MQASACRITCGLTAVQRAAQSALHLPSRIGAAGVLAGLRLQLDLDLTQCANYLSHLHHVPAAAVACVAVSPTAQLQAGSPCQKGAR